MTRRRRSSSLERSERHRGVWVVLCRRLVPPTGGAPTRKPAVDGRRNADHASAPTATAYFAPCRCSLAFAINLPISRFPPQPVWGFSELENRGRPAAIDEGPPPLGPKRRWANRLCHPPVEAACPFAPFLDRGVKAGASADHGTPSRPRSEGRAEGATRQIKPSRSPRPSPAYRRQRPSPRCLHAIPAFVPN